MAYCCGDRLDYTRYCLDGCDGKNLSMCIPLKALSPIFIFRVFAPNFEKHEGPCDRKLSDLDRSSFRLIQETKSEKNRLSKVKILKKT